jgi:hypothetical protein
MEEGTRKIASPQDPPWKKEHKKIASHLTRRRRKYVEFGNDMAAVEKEITKRQQKNHDPTKIAIWPDF